MSMYRLNTKVASAYLSDFEPLLQTRLLSCKDFDRKNKYKLSLVIAETPV